MLISGRNKNCSYYTLRRLLILPDYMYDKGLINSYLYTKDITQLNKYNDNKHIFLKLDLNFIKEGYKEDCPLHDILIEFTNRLKNSYTSEVLYKNEIIDIRIYGEFVIIVMKLNKEFYDDVDVFIKGKYSQFSELAKKSALRSIAEFSTSSGKQTRNKLWSLFYPTVIEKNQIEEMFNCWIDKEFQTMSKPIIEEETLKLK